MSDRLQTLDDAEAALRPYVPLVAQLTGGDTTLQRIEPLMSLLGNPERRLRIVHVAGTSGKTSTSYYIAGLLQAAGQKVGLTVSPHVDKVSERVQINSLPLSDADFCSELEEFLELVDQAAQPPSYFELLYAFSLWVFERQAVDYAVIETGMGGLHDATNVAKRADKFCIITDIGYDHMQVLGHTLPEIAMQKIGIMHAGNVGITYQQDEVVMEAYVEWTAAHNATLEVLTEDIERHASGQSLDHLPLYQQRNWLLAYAAYRRLAARDQLPLLRAQQLLETQQIQVPARMQIVTYGDKTIVMDGAHNEQKMTAFADSFRVKFQATKPAVLLALKTGKEHEAVSPILTQLASQIIVTTFDTSQDLPAVSMDPEALAESLRVAGATNVQVVPDQRLAYDTLMKTAESVVVITGSFYLLSQLRREVLAG
jgi:dihydrofolate synthase/folylpolyglutamate synthase